MARVLICGDRNWNDRELIRKVIKSIKAELKTVIEGEARGADFLAREVAKEEGIEVLPFPAAWGKHGKAAGPIRNQRMLVEGNPDLVIAFHDDLESSKGTKDMITRALKRGIQVWHYSHTEMRVLEPTKHFGG